MVAGVRVDEERVHAGEERVRADEERVRVAGPLGSRAVPGWLGTGPAMTRSVGITTAGRSMSEEAVLERVKVAARVDGDERVEVGLRVDADLLSATRAHGARSQTCCGPWPEGRMQGAYFTAGHATRQACNTAGV